jgi:hypothetical protein
MHITNAAYMNLAWYLHRLKKMSVAEIAKRVGEHSRVYYSRTRYRRFANWQYSRFAPNGWSLVLRPLPAASVAQDWERYHIYGMEFDLTGSIEWLFSEAGPSRVWPSGHYSTINYRPGNPHGDVRINWELNRLQFLPAMAVADENLAHRVLADWLAKNLYLAGPAYIASMEVALRWLSIYRAVCLFKTPIEGSLQKDLVGLAVASGRYIERRLSTHSSAGNHLIVEAVGLFWLGCALENVALGSRWKEKGCKILFEQVLKQINEDGTNQEQTFWYLGFVLDAFFHYLLLEEKGAIPADVRKRIVKALEFVVDMISPDGSFPDYGDRDDGFVFRVDDDYSESPFPGLLSIGAYLFSRLEWHRTTERSSKAVAFWSGTPVVEAPSCSGRISQRPEAPPSLATYAEGGMTLVSWDKCKVLFRHSRLGLGNTGGHGHADALSIIFSWHNVPVLIDLGSGQYNGDQAVRNYFRSTIAHNTVEVNGRDQARIVGPFLWDIPYEAELLGTGITPHLFVEARHNGYEKQFGIVHTRRLDAASPRQWIITDHFSNAENALIKGAFHLGKCRHASRKDNVVTVDFSDFIFTVVIPAGFEVEMFHGSRNPFLGWASVVYGEWEPIYSLIFSTRIAHDQSYKIMLNVEN